jgi:hypothetical protein
VDLKLQKGAMYMESTTWKKNQLQSKTETNLLDIEDVRRIPKLDENGVHAVK